MPRDPIGAVVRNLFDMQRMGTSIARLDADPFIRDLFDDIAAQIARIDPTSPQRERYRQQRLEKLVGDVEGLVGKSFREIRRTLETRLATVGEQQARWAAFGLGQWTGPDIEVSTGRISRTFMREILQADPFEGETLHGWVEEIQAPATVRRVRRALQLGMAEGESIDDMVRRVRGRSNGRGGFTGGILQTTTRETEAIVRTGVNFIANRGQLATYQENADILEGLEFTATLDSDTTLVCRSLDGELLDVENPDPAKIPPRHFNCRSVLTPRVGWAGLGIEPPPEGTRASEDGQVASSTTQTQWLRDQTKAEQDRILGPARAQLFRDGKVTLKDLVTKDQRIVPLDQLVARVG